MTLSEFLADARMTRTEFAAKVGAHPITVSKWATGKAMPRWPQMKRIVEATAGKVRPADFYAEAEVA